MLGSHCKLNKRDPPGAGPWNLHSEQGLHGLRMQTTSLSKGLGVRPALRLLETPLFLGCVSPPQG